MVKEERKSNFELLRIISMLFIILWHFIYHGNIWSNSSQLSSYFWSFLTSLIYIHVNLFVLLSGYFNCEKKFRLSKAISINNSIWFYSVIFVLLGIFVFNKNIPTIEIIKSLLPITFWDYWFLTCYLLLYFLSPILNTVINNIDNKKYKKIILVYFILLIFMPYITNGEFYNVDSGYSLINFVFLYLLGAYLKKNPIQDSYHFKKCSKNKIKLILLNLYIFTAFVNFLIYIFGNNLINFDNDLVKYIGSNLINGFLAYNNPLLIAGCVAFFLYFSLLDFKNRYINIISKYVLGCYLITENNYIRDILYNSIGFNKMHYSITIIPKLFLFVFIVFICCILIEAIRQFIFRKVYNLKISGKFREKCKNYIKTLDIDINW